MAKTARTALKAANSRLRFSRRKNFRDLALSRIDARQSLSVAFSMICFSILSGLQSQNGSRIYGAFVRDKGRSMIVSLNDT